MARPVSVTVVLWVIIALTLESLAGLFGPFANSFLAPVAMKHDSSLASTLWSGVAFGIAQILLAFLMLRGRAWFTSALLEWPLLPCCLRVDSRTSLRLLSSRARSSYSSYLGQRQTNSL